MSGRHDIMVLRRGDTTSAAPTSTIIRSPVFIALLGVILCLLLLVLALGMVLRKANTKLETSPTCVTCTSVQYTEVQLIQRPGHTLGYEDRRQASRSDVSVIEAKNLTLHPAGLQVMNRTVTTLSEVPLVPFKSAPQERTSRAESSRVAATVRPDRYTKALPSFPEPVHKLEFTAACYKSVRHGSGLSSADLKPGGATSSELSISSPRDSANFHESLVDLGSSPSPGFAKESISSPVAPTVLRSTAPSALTGRSLTHPVSLPAHCRPRPPRQPSQLSSSWIPDDEEDVDSDSLKEAEVRQVTAVAYLQAPNSPNSRYPTLRNRDRPLPVMLSLPYELAERGSTPIFRGPIPDVRDYPVFYDTSGFKIKSDY
jgi:hypothetical protein